MTPAGDIVAVDDAAAAFADLVVAERPAILALSGGETARQCYEVLATRGSIDWQGITVLFGDERWVPVEHPDSNEGMARAELLDHVRPRAVHSLRGAGATPAAAAAAYDALVRSLGPIDLVHLGLGPDGHTASLFPGSPALEDNERLVVATEPGRPPLHQRLTVTLAAINRARHAVITVDGESKAEAWRRVRRGDDLPATRVRSARVTWLVHRSLA